MLRHILTLGLAALAAGSDFDIWRTGLPPNGFEHHAIAVNKRSWPSSALFEPDALLSSVAKPLQTGAPGEKFRLYLLDTATTSSSSSSVAWPEHAVAVVYTSYSGYLPYVHGLSDDRNATVSAVALARFAALAVSVGDPSGVAAVRSGDELLDLIDTVDPPRPVMAFFSAFASPHSVRARPFFEAAAALYGRQLPFAEVRCSGRGSSEVLAALCSKLNVTSFPTLGLYTGEEWIPFDIAGSARTPGDIELFLWRHRRRFPHAIQALEAALPAAAFAAAASGKPEQAPQAAQAAQAAQQEAGLTPSGSSSSDGAPLSSDCSRCVTRDEVSRMIADAMGDVLQRLLKLDEGARTAVLQAEVDKLAAARLERKRKA